MVCTYHVVVVRLEALALAVYICMYDMYLWAVVVFVQNKRCANLKVDFSRCARWCEIVDAGVLVSIKYQVHWADVLLFLLALVFCRVVTTGAVQALEDDRQRRGAELERSKNVMEAERAELQRARGDLDRFSARVSEHVQQ